MGMIINPYRFSSSVLLLDETNLGSAHAAYSVARKLRSAYVGSCIRVRRSSDQAEQDIGFSANELDQSALTTFVGANNGFVVTLYDQSGNGYNATMSTAANQMTIVSSGSVVTENGKPAMTVNDNTDYYQYSGAAISSSDVISVVSVSKTGAADGTNYLKTICRVGAVSNNAAVFLSYGSYNQSGDVRKPTLGQIGQTANNAESTSANTNQVLMAGFVNGTGMSFYEDDASEVNGTNSVSLAITNGGLMVGAYNISFPATDGNIQDVVVWIADLEAYVETIKSNVNGFYSIY